MYAPRSTSRLLTGRTAGATALLAVFLAAFCGLGLWQFEGWQAQRAAEERDLSTRTPVALTSVIGPDDPFPGDEVGRPVSLRGEWLPGTGFVVGPRRGDDGTDGWWSAAVVAVDGTGTSVPVVTGWSPRPAQPDLAGPVAVTGFLQPGEGSLAADPDPTDRVLPELRLATLTDFVPQDLVSAFVVASDVAPAVGLPLVPPEQVPAVGASTALRNLLYALQWWLLAIMALVIWGRFVRDELAAPDPAPVDPARFGA